MRTQITKILTTIILSYLGAGISVAQDLDAITFRYFASLRSGIEVAIPEEMSASENASEILEKLAPFLRDTLSIVSVRAFDAAHALASKSADPLARSKGLDLLFLLSNDKEPAHKAKLLSSLTRYARNDFSASARDSIRSFTRRPGIYFGQVLRLAGFLKMTDLIPEIRPWAQPGNPASVRWAALLSLARMGDRAAQAEIFRRIEVFSVDDQLVYNIFPDLIYTRAPEFVQLMITSLSSDDNNCLSADAERSVPIPCGYRIMEQLAPVIEGFPLEIHPSGDLITDDYMRALDIARTWFAANKMYRIIDDTY